MNFESRMNNALRNNPEIEEFLNQVDNRFVVRRSDVHTMIHDKVFELSGFDAFKLEPEQYIDWALEICYEWLTLERREIKASDLINYSKAYLYFQAIERKK